MLNMHVKFYTTNHDINLVVSDNPVSVTGPRYRRRARVKSASRTPVHTRARQAVAARWSSQKIEILKTKIIIKRPAQQTGKLGTGICRACGDLTSV
jgi:hypothetical protein